MGEFGAVQDNDGVGGEGHCRTLGFLDAAPDGGEARQDVKRAHHGNLGQRKQRGAALLRHELTAHAFQLEGPRRQRP
jgi:hypothetical protein